MGLPIGSVSIIIWLTLYSSMSQKHFVYGTEKSSGNNNNTTTNNKPNEDSLSRLRTSSFSSSSSAPAVDKEKSADHFYVEKIFEKYGQDGRMSFEGFEHLLENLDLARITFLDHDVHDHRMSGKNFRQLHKGKHHHEADEEEEEGHDHSHEHAGEHGHAKDDGEGHKHDHGHKHLEMNKGQTKHENGHNHSGEHEEENKGHNHGNSRKQSEEHHHEEEGHKHENGLEHTGQHHHEEEEGHKHENDHEHTGGEEDRKSRKRRQLDKTKSEGKLETQKMQYLKHHDQFHHELDQDLEADLMHTSWEERPSCLDMGSYWLNQTNNFEDGMSAETFRVICPSLIYQIDSGACLKEKKRDRFGHTVRLGELPISFRSASSISATTWLSATGAIIIVSLCGVVGVAIVPLMRNHHFDTVLQFFIALAVGSLSGDALLHLLPHALAVPHGSSSDDHSNNHGGTHAVAHVIGVGKGLMASAGLFAFFIIERIMILFKSRNTKRRSNKKGKRTTTVEVFMESESQNPKSDEEDCKQIMIDPSSENNHSNNNSHSQAVGHGHSHGHGTANGGEMQNKSLSSLALMVILGDGIHNFCDGAAIGAAFIASTTVGFSTTIAVICHELPHEIGDFAVLINTGMTLKRAFFFNIVSSILSLFGMICGVLIAGSFHETSSWIFAMTAGSFLYISLADLLPELNSPTENNKTPTQTPTKTLTSPQPISPVKIFLIHLLGIFIGIFIMALIGVYEENLKRIFEFAAE